MADMTNNLLKRPHPEDDDAASKRARSNNGSPRPTTPNAAAAPPAKQDVNAMLAAARAKAEALKARMAGNKPVTPALAPAGASSTAQDRIAQLKARVAAATSRSTDLAQQKGPAAASYAPARWDDMPKSRGGLDIGLHPDLLADSRQDARATKGRATPKFATTMGNRQTESPGPEKKQQLDLSGPSIEEIKSNPYFDESLGPRNVVAKGRHSRQLLFNQKGKYIQQAASLRKQFQLEDMKRRIAERARLAGIDEELNVEKAFAVPEPPAIEWWDEGLVDGESYNVLDDPSKWKIDTADSIITIYIQHPVLIEPPQEKIIPAAKPMYLTKDEQAKLRRQRRMADLKEQQAKIRLGLEEPPPPKVKKGNLMRVLGSAAVKDPTFVERRVNAEIAQRKQDHVEMNEDRKLTKEQRVEKLDKQQAEDEAKGIYVRVYKIDNLANGKHRYQININAEQQKLTGVCIMHPKLNVVVIEGGEHSVRFYDKLMQNRIKWQEMEAPRAVQEGNREALAKWLDAEDENGELKDLSLNKCELVFAGEEKRRAFRKWVGARVCETDAQAKDVLARARMESMWNVAKSFKKDY
jgi:U4/U6 small nuclear ribonucleoprotein PRP3